MYASWAIHIRAQNDCARKPQRRLLKIVREIIIIITAKKKKEKKPPPWKVSLFSFRTWTFDKVIITEAYMCVYTHTKVQQHFLLLFRSFIYSFLHLFFFYFIAISLGSPLLFYISSSKAAVTQPLSVFLPKCRVCCNRETHMWVAQVVNILCILIDPFSSRTVLCSPFFSALFVFLNHFSDYAARDNKHRELYALTLYTLWKSRRYTLGCVIITKRLISEKESWPKRSGPPTGILIMIKENNQSACWWWWWWTEFL